MAKVDDVTLSEDIKLCFQMAMDLRYTRSQRENFNEHGETLRKQLAVLYGKYFTSGVDKVASAKANIAKVNGELKKTIENIHYTTEMINNLGMLVHQLSELIKILG